jgi:hypothetical protein
MLNSPKTYNIIRESGVLSLPSTRTLKDYSNWFKSEAGFQDEVFTMLYEDYNIPSLNLAQRQVVLSFDEMKIKEGLVFDRESNQIIGYVDTGDINSKLKSFEASINKGSGKEDVATHMLALCIRGIFKKLEYPIAQFPTTSTLLCHC